MNRIDFFDIKEIFMDTKNLSTFIQVAELSSFTKAAEKLGFSQSTVSFQIKQLESELDTRLFDRFNHTVVLTEKGKEVLQYAHQILQFTQKMTADTQMPKIISGHVRLAMADSLCHSLLSDNFCRFRKQYPGITLKITAAETEEMFRLLKQNETDLVLTLDSHIYNTEYIIAKEERIPMHFVASPRFPAAMQSPCSVRELAGQPFILTEKGMSYRRLLDEKLAERSLEIRPILEIGSTDLICHLVEQGTGISFLPDFVTARRIKEGRLVYVQTEDLDIDVWKQLLYHRDKWVSAQMKSVLEYCINKEF